jgi:hypothetical protein
MLQVVEVILVHYPFVQGKLGGSMVHQFFAHHDDGDDSHGKLCAH